MALIPYAVKFARFFDVERHPSGRLMSDYDKERKAAGLKKRKRKSNAKTRRRSRRKLKSKAHLRQVLKMAREVLKNNTGRS